MAKKQKSTSSKKTLKLKDLSTRRGEKVKGGAIGPCDLRTRAK